MKPDPISRYGKSYRAAVIGTGPLFLRLLDILAPSPEIQGQNGMIMVGAAPLGGEEESREAGKSGIRLFGSEKALLEENRINVIFAPGVPEREATLRACLPEGGIFLDNVSCQFFASLADSDRLCKECRVDLMHARSMLETVLDELSDDILLLDCEGRIIDVNRSVYERRGKTKEDFLGFYVWEALDEEENLCRPPEFDCPMGKTIHKGEPAEALYTHVDLEGRLRYYRVYTYPIFDNEGQVSHVAEIRRDITRRTSMERRLQDAEKLAAIGELSTYIAHEIRNPLFAISGFANKLLKNPNLDEDAREKAEIILEESKRLDRLLKNILNFTRPITGKAGEVDVNRIVKDTTNVLALGCEKQGIGVNVELAEALPKAKADAELVRQVFLHLAKNAIEAMPEGGTLTARTFLTSNRVVLEVKDTGIGIPEKNLSKVFTPFFSTKDDAAGLGLPIINKIIEDMGGNFSLESREGVGTKAFVCLPPLLAAPGKDDTAAD